MDSSMNFRTTALSLLTRVQAGLSHTELVHIPHPLWPFSQPHLQSNSPKTEGRKPLRISILDASFNPPTLAHLALTNATIPPHSTAHGTEQEDYDARLLLLSVKNADKTLKSTDATYIQRLEMMRLLARSVYPGSSPSDSASTTSATMEQNANVAIGIINEPTFVGKSTTLLSFLKDHVRRLTASPQQLSPSENVPYSDVHFELSFIVGMDTLERLVAPRYYASEQAMITSLRRFLSPQEENSLVVCARRQITSSFPTLATTSIGVDTPRESDPEDTGLKPAQEFIDAGRIKLIDIGAEESTYSSTTVRNSVKGLGVGEEARRQWGQFVLPSVADYIVAEGLYIE